MKHKIQNGQALVTLLFFMIVSITITTAAVMIVVTNSIGASKIQQGEIGFSVAESGMENALIRLLRNPSYSGETLDVGNGEAIITVSGTSPIIITSEGFEGNFKRTIEVQAQYVNSILTVTSWKEKFQ